MTTTNRRHQILTEMAEVREYLAECRRYPNRQESGSADQASDREQQLREELDELELEERAAVTAQLRTRYVATHRLAERAGTTVERVREILADEQSVDRLAAQHPGSGRRGHPEAYRLAY